MRTRSTGADGFPDLLKITAAPKGTDHPFCSPAPQWDLPEAELEKVMGEVPGIRSLERIGQYFCFEITEEAYEKGELTPKPVLKIALKESWRSQEVHRQLKEVKRVLNRFRKLTVDLMDRDHPLPEKPEASIDQSRTPSERAVFAAECWVIYRLWNRRDPWPVSGLAELLGEYTDALKDCWTYDRIDGEGELYVSALRTRRWAANGRMIRRLLEAMQP